MATVALFFVCVACLVCSSLTQNTCPNWCLCFPLQQEGGLVNGYRTDCSGLWLRKIPQGISQNTTQLYLHHNYLQAIHYEFQNLTKLKVLRLDGNFIEIVRSGAFRTVSSLEELYLQNNCIHKLNFGAFHGLKSLRRLDLSNNEMKSFESGVFDELVNVGDIDLSYNRLISMPDGAFRNLSNLTNLSLTNNEIFFLGNEAFCNLTSLAYLNLAVNHLTTVPESAVCGLNSVRTLILLENRIECDCEAIWLYEFLVNNRLSSPNCYGPPTLRGTSLIKLLLSDFCVTPTASLQASKRIWTTGVTLNITCQASGVPFPSIIFLKDQKRVFNGSSSVLIDNGKLTISSVSQNYSGWYQCIVSSQAGISSSNSVFINIIDMITEQISGIRHLVHSRGSRVEIPCSNTTQLNMQSFNWLFNGAPLSISDRLVVLSNGDLIITEAQFHDSGMYTCQLNGLMISRTVQIEEKANVVVFPEPLCDDLTFLTLDSDKSYQLECTATGNPLPFVRWSHNGLLAQQILIQKDNYTATSFLNISSPSKLDEGAYHCLALNTLGHELRNIMVSVRVLAELDRTDLHEIFGKAGDTLTLPCDTSSFTNVLSILWVKQDGRNLSRSSVTDRDGSLVIVMATIMDTGVYDCLVQTTLGIATVRHNVTVYGSPVIVPDCAVATRVVQRGDNVTLFCDVVGSPTPAIEWLKDMQPLHLSLINVSYTLHLSNKTLLIFNIDQVGPSLFTCLAANEFGNTTYSLILDVQVAPSFIHRPSDVTVNVGQPATFHCEGQGHPTPLLMWWTVRNDWPIPLETTGRVIISNDYLTIVKTVKSDAGVYFCTLNSTVATVMSNMVFLTVYVPPTLINNLPTALETMERHPITLPCMAIGDPVPAILWFKDGIMLPIEGRHYKDPFGNLRILDPMKEDEGKYTCSAANPAGVVDHNVILSVLRMPNIQVQPTVQVVQEDCIALFSCLDSGESPQNISWYFQGQAIVRSSRILVRPSGDLIILNVTLSDAGVYQCQLVSGSGIGTVSNATLFVEEKPTINATDPTPMSPMITVQSPFRHLVTEGDFAQFVCLVEAYPLSTISWYHNGVPVSDIMGHISVKNELLIVHNVTFSDAGIYQCNAVNILGENTVNFSLIVSSPPLLENVSHSMDVLELEPIRLVCVARGIPPPDIQWLVNGSVIGRTDRVTVSSIDGSSSLVIVNTTFADTGEYTCDAVNEAGQTSHSIFVRVMTVVDVQPPRITIQPRNTDVRTGQSFNLTCVSSGDPTPLITWTKDGIILLNSSRVFISTDVIVVSSSVKNDSGLYTCIATNLAGEASHGAYVLVSDQTVFPSFTMQPESVSTLVGDNIVLQCTANGFPTPDVKWQDSDVFSERVVVYTNGTLVINNATVNDSGKYICLASNIAGVSKIQVNVKVNIRTERPQFTLRPPVSFEGTKGQNITFDCSASGIPVPTYVWFVNGINTSVYNPMRFNVRPDGSLFIRDAQISDTGNYSCVADNGVGSAEVLFSVTITDVASPLFRIVLTDQSVLERSSVNLSCDVVGVPIPKTYWMYNGVKISSGNGITFDVDGSLRINEVQLIHSGNYTCMAINSAGSVHSNITLKVLEREEPPYFVSCPNDTRVMQGQNFCLKCDVKGPGNITLTWLYNNQPIWNEFLNVSIHQEGKVLCVNKAKQYHSGKYTCRAQNQFGTSNAVAYVQVHTHFPNTTKTIVKGSSTHLICQDISPQDTVTWSMNNHVIQEGSFVNRLHIGKTLWIYDVTIQDEGDYSCFTKNSPQETFYIRVMVPPFIKPFRKNKIIGKKGSHVILNCPADGKPSPEITWRHKAKELIICNKYSIFSNGTLVIYSVNFSDSGQYTCNAFNSIGSVESALSLNIIL